MTETRFLLSERTNPNSKVRADGNRWWGHPTRQGTITAIVVHTAETSPSPASALNVARWQAYTAAVPSSYHVIVDSDHAVRTVLDTQTAFHCVGFNPVSVGLSFATRASLWGRWPVWDEQALARAAAVSRQWMALYGIPARWLTRVQASRGVKGFVRHSTMDPGRRSDPGHLFPAGRFFALLADPDPEPEDPMADYADELAAIARNTQLSADDAARQVRLQAALVEAEIGRFRVSLGLADDPASDAIWSSRIAVGSSTLTEAKERLRATS